MLQDKSMIYIAGPIAGTNDFHERFNSACLELVQLGYTPISPLEVNGIDPGCREETSEARVRYLKADIRALMSCSGIYLLRGWENSRGARLEKLIADGLDMLVLYQEKRMENSEQQANQPEETEEQRAERLHAEFEADAPDDRTFFTLKLILKEGGEGEVAGKVFFNPAVLRREGVSNFGIASMSRAGQVIKRRVSSILASTAVAMQVAKAVGLDQLMYDEEEEASGEQTNEQSAGTTSI
jgi:hypothetical protein